MINKNFNPRMPQEFLTLSLHMTFLGFRSKNYKTAPSGQKIFMKKNE